MATTTPAHKKRMSVILPPKDTKDRPDYLAAKRRPISMQFPAPPAPIKSSKPPTKSTFVLPSEALEAKRKAARLEREERRRKEDEDIQKRREFKARPAPGACGATVRQTVTSAKRMSVVIGTGELAMINAASKENTKPLTTANKRASILHGRTDSVANAAAKRSSIMGVSIGPAPAQKRSSIIVPKRQSVISTPLAAPGSASPLGPGVKSTISQDDVAAQRARAREIYSRDKAEKDARVKDRKEKEEAAKRARAEAAEKGRQASREWAEKNKRRALSAKRTASGAQNLGQSPIQGPATIAV
jgi:hypothetical protein